MMSTHHWAFLCVCVRCRLSVCKRRKERKKWHRSCHFGTIAIYSTRLIVCVVAVVVCERVPACIKCAFCFVKDIMSCLYRSLRLVLMCWYLIWHPSTLPHNPLALKETNFTASPFCLSIAFFLWGPDPAGVRPSQCLNGRLEMGLFHPHRHLRQPHCIHALFKIPLGTFAAEMRPPSLVAAEKKKLGCFDLRSLDSVRCDPI